jgi:hypothetical protein
MFVTLYMLFVWLGLKVDVEALLVGSPPTPIKTRQWMARRQKLAQSNQGRRDTQELVVRRRPPTRFETAATWAGQPGESWQAPVIYRGK